MRSFRDREQVRPLMVGSNVRISERHLAVIEAWCLDTNSALLVRTYGNADTAIKTAARYRDKFDHNTGYGKYHFYVSLIDENTFGVFVRRGEAWKKM